MCSHINSFMVRVFIFVELPLSDVHVVCNSSEIEVRIRIQTSVPLTSLLNIYNVFGVCHSIVCYFFVLLIWTGYQTEFCCSKCQWTVIINKLGTWKKISTTFNVLLVHHHKNFIVFKGVLGRLLSVKCSQNFTWFMCTCFPTCVTTYFTSIASLASKRCFYFMGNWLPNVSGPGPEFLMGRTRSYFLSKFLQQLRTS